MVVGDKLVFKKGEEFDFPWVCDTLINNNSYIICDIDYDLNRITFKDFKIHFSIEDDDIGPNIWEYFHKPVVILNKKLKKIGNKQII